MAFLIFILAISSVTAELQHVFLLGPGDGSGGHVETLEIYYSEEGEDPRFVTKDNGSIFLGSSKDNTVKLLDFKLACANNIMIPKVSSLGIYTRLEDE